VDLSFVIVNWNTRDLLRDCLRSVYDTVRDASFEVLVVDNGSADGSTAMLRESFPAVRVIGNRENRGFAAANNQAFRVMEGRYALLLNTDAVLTEGAVDALFRFMEGRPDAAMACGQLLNRDGSLQNSVAAFPTLFTLAANMPLLEILFPRRFPSKRYRHTEPVEVDSGVGACLMVRRKAMDEVGLLDERYFFYFEETDWAYAMSRKGWKVYHVPAARIYHYQGQSVGTGIASRMAFYRSRYAFFRKWYGKSHYAVVCCLLFARLAVNAFLSTAGMIVTLGRHAGLRRKADVYQELLAWHLRGFPDSPPSGQRT
jgi:GT2 family glycosyltransferase